MTVLYELTKIPWIKNECDPYLAMDQVVLGFGDVGSNGLGELRALSLSTCTNQPTTIWLCNIYKIARVATGRCVAWKGEVDIATS